jgi:hypothetical protein
VRLEADDDIDGPAARYNGSIDLQDIRLIAGAEADGIAEATIWIRTESQLPVRVEISEPGRAGAAITIN